MAVANYQRIVKIYEIDALLLEEEKQCPDSLFEVQDHTAFITQINFRILNDEETQMITIGKDASVKIYSV